MTTTDLTRSLIYLNLYDMDGLIDIARYGIDEDNLTHVKCDLIRRLASAIIQPVAPLDFDDTNSVDDPEPQAIFEGRVALAIFPLEKLKSLSPEAVAHNRRARRCEP